jgi:hypothetical protein
MPTHNNHGEGNGSGHGMWQEPEEHGPEKLDVSAGYEATDVGVPGIIWFLTSLAIFVAVTGVLCWGIGKVINSELNREDGPNTKWTKAVDLRELGNLPNNPELQNKVAVLAHGFPSPRVQTDDGNEDTAELHGREDLLLNYYSWTDRSKGKVRIPIERAMELIAQRGLPVAPAVEHAPLMAGEEQPKVTQPLTNGFARTSYELEQARIRAAEEGKQ